MRDTSRHHDYIAGRDVDFNTAFAFFAIGGFGPPEDEPRFTLYDGCDAQ
jgi:hypothetical protein